MFKGDCIELIPLDEGFVELRFARRDGQVNKLDQATIAEWQEANARLSASPDIRGILLTSASEAFIVGADIGEFASLFKLPAEDIHAYLQRINAVACAFEDLPMPSVAAINGLAFGGGLEVALCAGWRVMSSDAQLSLPEVKLGLYPALGGTLRLSRVVGLKTAVEWITEGRTYEATAALAAGVVDATTHLAQLRETALDFLRRAAEGELDWTTRQYRKTEPLAPEKAWNETDFDRARERLARSTRHQPAAKVALDVLQQAACLKRQAALRLEAEGFVELARGQVADALIQNFHNDQAGKRRARQYARAVPAARQVAVLGAGIMGSGIAFSNVQHGVSVRLKDVSAERLDAADCELHRLAGSARLDEQRTAELLASVRGQLDFTGFDQIELVLEAVTESLLLKHALLTEAEGQIGEDCLIATNTSSLCIDEIAKALARPQNLVGMHFFNPVPRMPLVEVVRGQLTSDQAVAAALSHAVAMGKTPVLVKDCPGFLVNRVFTPYILAFLRLLGEGAEFVAIDRALERFGWPMGPAALLDVIGLDTAAFVFERIAAGYPERMPGSPRELLGLLLDSGRQGKKNGHGFYDYSANEPGKQQSARVRIRLEAASGMPARFFDEQEIVDRLMLPLLFEASLALDEGVVGSAGELDLALQLGLGFPRHLGGPLKYIDWLGLPRLVELSERYGKLGAEYRVGAQFRDRASQGRTHYA